MRDRLPSFWSHPLFYPATPVVRGRRPPRSLVHPATYVVEAQGTDLNGTAFDKRETVIATITSASATTLGIAAGMQGGPPVDYLVPIGDAVTPIAPDATPSASGLSYSRTYPAQYQGHAIGAGEVITLQGGWVSEIDIAFTGIHTRSFTLQAVATTGPAPVPAGSALWILPMFMPPNAGVTVAGSAQGAGILAAAGPVPRTLSIADSQGPTTRTLASDGTISMISGSTPTTIRSSTSWRGTRSSP